MKPLDRARLAAALLAMALAGTGDASAGMPNQPCSRPTVFPGAAVNTVVLPYSRAVPGEPEFESAGDQLSLLVHFETFFSMLKYGSSGGIRLIEDRHDLYGCDAKRVYEQLMGDAGGAVNIVGDGKALVLIWGRIFQEGESVFIQSYLRFERKGAEESLSLDLGGEKLTGSLSFQAIAFPPRLVTTEDLAEIEETATNSAKLRDEPGRLWPWQRSGKSTPMRLDRDVHTAYGVVEHQSDGWIKIESFDKTTSGWIKASHSQDAWSLREKLPELSLVDGLVGYLRYRAGPAGHAVPSEKEIREWSSKALERYAKMETPTAREPLALAGQIRAFLDLLSAPGDPKVLDHAQARFGLAAELVPYDADARNLALISEAVAGFGSERGQGRPKEMAAKFLNAASLEPGNPILLANLESLYRSFRSEGQPAGLESRYQYEQAELDKALEFVQSVKSKKP